MSGVLLQFDYLAETIASLTLVYSLIFFFYKPYVSTIHIYVNLFNQSIVLAFLAIEILGKYDFLNDKSKTVCIYIIVSLIFVALVLQMTRVYYVYKLSLKQKFKLEN